MNAIVQLSGHKESCNMKITDSKTTTFSLTGDSVTVEISNTKRHFKWRLRIGKHSTDWFSYYQGILSIRSPYQHSIFLCHRLLAWYFTH
jgi:hypothetical protein